MIQFLLILYKKFLRDPFTTRLCLRKTSKVLTPGTLTSFD